MQFLGKLLEMEEYVFIFEALSNSVSFTRNHKIVLCFFFLFYKIQYDLVHLFLTMCCGSFHFDFSTYQFICQYGY